MKFIFIFVCVFCFLKMGNKASNTSEHQQRKQAYTNLHKFLGANYKYQNALGGKILSSSFSLILSDNVIINLPHCDISIKIGPPYCIMIKPRDQFDMRDYYVYSTPEATYVNKMFLKEHMKNGNIVMLSAMNDPYYYSYGSLTDPDAQKEPLVLVQKMDITFTNASLF